MAGINRAKHIYFKNKLITEDMRKNFSQENCIFLSHNSIDKPIVRKIGEHIMTFGIDIYLDENDENLQLATSQSNDEKITECIHNGINSSTHIMCLISEQTKSSWWVSYEISFAKKAEKIVNSLIFKNVTIPSFLKINTCLENKQSLDNYLQEIGSVASTYSQWNHPLDAIIA